MKYIKTFDELDDIQKEMWKHTCTLDLSLLREAHFLIDSILIICMPTTEWYADEGVFLLKNEDFEKWFDGQKDYFRHYYGLD